MQYKLIVHDALHVQLNFDHPIASKPMQSTG